MENIIFIVFLFLSYYLVVYFYFCENQISSYGRNTTYIQQALGSFSLECLSFCISQLRALPFSFMCQFGRVRGRAGELPQRAAQEVPVPGLRGPLQEVSGFGQLQLCAQPAGG